MFFVITTAFALFFFINVVTQNSWLALIASAAYLIGGTVVIAWENLANGEW